MPDLDTRGVELIEVQALSTVLGLSPGQIATLPIDTPELLAVLAVGHAVQLVDGVPVRPVVPKGGGCGCGG